MTAKGAGARCTHLGVYENAANSVHATDPHGLFCDGYAKHQYADMTV